MTQGTRAEPASWSTYPPGDGTSVGTLSRRLLLPLPRGTGPAFLDLRLTCSLA